MEEPRKNRRDARENMGEKLKITVEDDDNRVAGREIDLGRQTQGKKCINIDRL